MSKGSRQYVVYICKEGYEVVRSDNLPIPPEEIELVVVDKKLGYFFTDKCLKCKYGRWKKEMKYCSFVLKKNESASLK